MFYKCLDTSICLLLKYGSISKSCPYVNKVIHSILLIKQDSLFKVHIVKIETQVHVLLTPSVLNLLNVYFTYSMESLELYTLTYESIESFPYQCP